MLSAARIGAPVSARGVAAERDAMGAGFGLPDDIAEGPLGMCEIQAEGGAGGRNDGGDEQGQYVTDGGAALDHPGGAGNQHRILRIIGQEGRNITPHQRQPMAIQEGEGVGGGGVRGRRHVRS